MPNQPMSDKKLIKTMLKKIKTKVENKKADGGTPINLVRIKICEKTRGKTKPKWEMWLPEEMVYKVRKENANDDEYLMSKIETRFRTRLAIKGAFVIKEIKEIKFLGYGTVED